MFDAYIGEVDLTLLAIVLSVVLVLPVQYWLCRTERALLVRLLPAIIFTLGGVVCIYLAYNTMDWDALFYALFAIYCGFLLAASVLGWALWAVIAWRRQRARSAE